MADATKFYLKQINKRSAGYRPNWEPNKPLKIGDIGRLEKGVFVLVSSLEKEGITMEVRIDEEEGDSIDLSSEKGIEVRAKAKGQIDPATPALSEVDAGFAVEFKKANSILFKVNGYKTHQIENLLEIEREVKKRLTSGDWEKDLVIINEIVEAKNATIMMSSEGGVSIGLKAKGNVGLEGMDVADANLDLGVDAGGKLSVSIIGQEGITPLYRASGIKRNKLKSRDIFGEPEEAVFGEIPMEEDEDE